MKHTQGPWIEYAPIIKGESNENYRFIGAGMEYFDEVNGGFHLSGFISPADASLLACAPCLLDCNIEAMYFLEHPAVHDVFRSDPELYERLENTIKKHREIRNRAIGGNDATI